MEQYYGVTYRGKVVQEKVGMPVFKVRKICKLKEKNKDMFITDQDNKVGSECENSRRED